MRYGSLSWKTYGVAVAVACCASAVPLGPDASAASASTANALSSSQPSLVLAVCRTLDAVTVSASLLECPQWTDSGPKCARPDAFRQLVMATCPLTHEPF